MGSDSDSWANRDLAQHKKLAPDNWGIGGEIVTELRSREKDENV